jgi:UrcA family protein
MNTVKTSKTAIKTFLMSVLGFGLFAGAAVNADQIGPSTLTRTVRFDDLNLATVHGQQVAQERVAQMARTLCDKVTDPNNLSHHGNYLACVDAAVAKGGASLQALISRQTTATFARADVK